MKNKKTIIACVIIGLIILGIGCFWLLGSKTYVVTFTNGETSEEVEVKSGNIVDSKSVSDSHFLGWYDKETNQKFDFTKPINQNYELVAKYEDKYTVTFDTAGGSNISSVKVYKDEKVNEPTSPTKTGMTFVEWQLNGESYDFESTVTENITLKAIWKESNGTFTVKFDTDGGSKIRNANVKVGKTVNKPANPTKRGYDFVEWQLNGSTYDFSKVVTSDITLKATWQEKEMMKVTFKNEDKVVKTVSVGKGDTLGDTPSVPAKEGYVFDGWYNGNSLYTSKAVINKDITLIAKFITIDQANLKKTISNIKNSKLKMEKGTDNLASSIKAESGCTVRMVNAPSTIERQSKDSTISLTFEATCGNETQTQKANVTVKASPYKYTKTPNSNMLNYDVTIEGGSFDGDAKLFLGNEGSFNVVSRKAVVENAKIEKNPTFKLRFNNDSSTLYTVTFRG